jgi:lambda family phage portal protein
MRDPVKSYLAQLEREHRTRDELKAQTSEAYKGAQVGRLTKNWMPEHRSGDAAISESWSLLTSRVRHEVRNSPLFKRARSTLIDLVVGSGIMTFAATNLDDGDDVENLDLDFALESDEFFEDWAQDWADVEGKLSLYDMQRLAFGETVEVGDGFLLECHRKDPGRPISLCYQLLEREQLDTFKDRPRSPGVNRITNGIEFDEANRPVAYWFYDAHPFDTSASGGSSFESRPVPASRVKHLFVPFRPSASIGISWFCALAQVGRDRDWYLGNELTTGALAALLTVLVKRKHPGAGTLGMEDGDDAEDDLGNELLKLGHGLVFEGGVDDEVEIIESKRPGSANANAFIDMIDHDAAAAMDLSYYRLTGRYSNTSYTAVRGAQLDDDAHTRPLQNYVGRRLGLQIRRKVNAQAAAMGLYRNLTAREFVLDQRRYQKFDVLGPGREQLDPEKETEASISKLRAGLSTLKIECGRRQLHYIRVLRQMALEKRLAGQLALTLDFSKGQGSRAEKTTTAAGSEERDAA